MSESNNTYHIDNSGAMGVLATGDSTVSDVKVEQTNIETKADKSLADAAKEIQELLTELEQTYPTNTVPEQMVVVQEAIQRIENNPTLKQRVIAALQGGTVEGFKKLL
ncbi:MAG: hypothetical protein F6K21_31200, partial [Symploca sp. SIO2D2]|nr:hypothetical protein [Symploca sp. SIO2D2]